MRLPLPLASLSPPLRRALLFGLGLVILFVAVQLAPSSASDPEVAYEAVRGGRSGPRLFSAGNLIALALLAGGGLLALRLRQQADTPSGASPLRLVGQLPLAQGQSLRLVRCRGEVLLLGVTAGQITLLQRYPDDLAGDATVSDPADFGAAPGAGLGAGFDGEPPPRFGALLHGSLGSSLGTHA